MKNLLPVLFLLLSSVVSAEELKFITVLSSPVGSFNKLEAVDPTSAAQGTKVNFCTSLGDGGAVELKGTEDASLGEVTLSSGTVLGRGDDGDYVLTNITLNSGGSIEGSRLLSNVVNIQGNAVGKSTNLYSNSLTVAGAKTTGLNVNNKSIMSGTGSAEEMVWSNEYQSDTSCGNTASCAKQYLLKSKGSAAGVCVNDQTRTTTERCNVPGPDVTADNGCGVIQEYCNKGAWAVGGCMLAPSSECVTGQTKKDCRSTAGTTTCVDYTCVGCKWTNKSSSKKWTVSSESYDYDTRRGHPWFSFCDLGRPFMEKQVSVCLLEHAPVTGGYKTTAIPQAGTSCSASYPERFLTGCSVSGKIYDADGRERDCYYVGTNGYTTYTVTYQTLECK